MLHTIGHCGGCESDGGTARTPKPTAPAGGGATVPPAAEHRQSGTCKTTRSPPAGRASGMPPCPYRLTHFPKMQEVPNLLATGQEKNEGTRMKGKGQQSTLDIFQRWGRRNGSRRRHEGDPPHRLGAEGRGLICSALGAERGVTKPHPHVSVEPRGSAGEGLFPSFLPLLSQDEVQSPWAGLLHCSLYPCPRGRDCRSLEHFSSMM